VARYVYGLLGFVQVGGEESEMGVVGEQNIFFPCLCVCRGRRGRE